MLLPEKIVVCFTKGYLCVGASRGSAHLKTFLKVRLWRWSDRNDELVRWSGGLSLPNLARS